MGCLEGGMGKEGQTQRQTDRLRQMGRPERERERDFDRESYTAQANFEIPILLLPLQC